MSGGQLALYFLAALLLRLGGKLLFCSFPLPLTGEAFEMLPLWDNEIKRRPAVMTVFLIAANLAVFAYEAFLASQSRAHLVSWITEYALIPSRLVTHFRDGAASATVFTSMFLHADVWHVVGNCWFLWIFGRNIEGRLGSFRFLIFYFICGVAAATLQVAVEPASTLPMIGASGAISGVLGACLVLSPFIWIYTLVPWFVPIIPIPAFCFLLVWFAVQAWQGMGSLTQGQIAQGGIAWWAHAGGFIAGVCLAIFARKMRWAKRR